MMLFKYGFVIQHTFSKIKVSNYGFENLEIFTFRKFPAIRYNHRHDIINNVVCVRACICTHGVCVHVYMCIYLFVHIVCMYVFVCVDVLWKPLLTDIPE